MFITDDAIFVHIPKTGGRSITAWFGAPAVSVDLNGNRIPPHATADDIRKAISLEEWDKRWSFSVVRNPWDRMVSMFYFYTTKYKLRKHYGENWKNIYNSVKDF